MKRGQRMQVNPVDDWCNISFDDVIIDEVLLPFTFIEKPFVPKQGIYASSAIKTKRGEIRNMGYETRFTLEVKDIDNVGYDSYKIVKYMHEKQDQDDWFYPFDYQIDNFIRDIQPEYGSVFALEFDESDGLRWYDHEKEMKQLSKEFPDVLFKLHGEGENNGDIWDKYFMGGKMQSCYAEIMCPPFDRSKLL